MNCCQICSKAIYTSDQLTGLKSTNLPLDWEEKNWTVQFLIPSRDITDPAGKTWPLGSPLFFHPSPFSITPPPNNLQINMLTYIERFCIDNGTFSKYFYQPKSLNALTTIYSWNIRSQQWSKRVNWNITVDGFFPFLSIV